MENELIMLITHCELELLQRNYQQVYSQWIKDEWSNLLQWATLNDYTTFDSDIANRYCKAIYGQNKLKDMEKFDKIIHRALRMLLSYQKEGDFEYRAPADIKLFIGQLGSQMETYLHQLRMSGLLTEGTLAIKRRYLQSFNTYLEEHRIALDDFNTDVLMNFYLNKNYSSISISNINPIIKSFLSWGYKNGLTAKDCSVFIMTNSYRKQRKLPTTYTEKEIKNMLVATDRNSPIGKRDYLILLLASEYGLRSSDIINFNFDQIDLYHLQRSLLIF